VVRGGVITKDESGAIRCSARSGQDPNDVGLPSALHGFRVVMAIESVKR